MWDNRCVLHCGRPWDEQRRRRVMHRTTVAGGSPISSGVRLTSAVAPRTGALEPEMETVLVPPR